MGDVIVKLVQRNRHQDFNDCIRSALFKLIFEWVVSEPNCRLPSRSDAKNRRWESKGSVAGATRDERTICRSFKYRADFERRMPSVARDGQNASATLRQNRQLTAQDGKAEKSWRIFRAKRRPAHRS